MRLSPRHSLRHRMLPVPAVERVRLDRREIDALEAADVDVDLIGVGARDVEGVDAACGAERVLRRAGVKPIGRQRIGAAEKLEGVARHDQMQEALLGADRAVAFGDAR